VPAPVVLAVDGNSLVHRSYHALASSAQPNWAVRGLLTQLVAAVERIRPAVVVVGFDDPDRSWRRERWPSYKANRLDKLESLVEQLTEAVAALRALGVAVCVPDGLEADDVLASAVVAARRAGARSVVMTSDRDAFSLICADAAVLRIINGGVEASPLMTADRLVLLLGVRPDQYRDFAALRGDPSDNLPGVRGIGPRTAAAILREFGTAAAAFADLDRVRGCLGAGVARRLGAPGAVDAWQLNCEVMTMRDDVPLPVRFDGGAGGPGMLPLPARAVEEVFRGLGMTWTTGPVRVLAEVEAELDTSESQVSWPAVTADEDVRQWSSYRAPRLPRLTPARPKAQQLSLFD
jgi:5'-3' exonuclease